jgi:DNA-binding response OmpR family regulator
VPRIHILLVDNDPTVCARIQQALGSGFLLQNVVSLMEARHYLAEYIPDILICEVLLSQESGLDLCRFVRRSSSPSLRHLPIMLLTSLTTLQDKIAGFDAGVDDYIVKPFDARHLAARIRLLLRIKRLQQHNAD